MKLMLKEYLANMCERGGLDILLVNLLSQMGLNVLTTPMRGTKQSRQLGCWATSFAAVYWRNC